MRRDLAWWVRLVLALLVIVGVPRADRLAVARRVTPATRSGLIDDIWSGHRLPTAGVDLVRTDVDDPLAMSPSNLLRVDQLIIGMDDNAGTLVMTASPWVWYPARGNGKLALVHHGHVPTESFDTLGVGDVIRWLVEDGFVVVGFRMPGDGSVPAHEAYPLPTDTLNYLKFFVEPVVRVINELGDEYSAVYMTGISGGGWTTTLAAAIDVRIQLSVPIAGSLPLQSPACRDWEQFLPGTNADYTALYLLAADRPGRAQLQLLNTYDNCCFSQAQYNKGPDYSASVAENAAGQGGIYLLVWDSTHTGHEISPYGLNVIELAFGDRID